MLLSTDIIRLVLMDLLMLFMLDKLCIDSITVNGTDYEKGHLLLRVETALREKVSPQWIHRNFIVVKTLELLGRSESRLYSSTSADKVGWIGSR